MARSQSPGTKTTRSKASSTPGQSKTSSKSSQKQQKKSSPSKNTATRKSTQQKLQENLKTLTSPKEKKKTGKTSGTRQKSKDPGIKAVRSYDRKLFPWETFPYRLDDKRDKKVCHFQCFEHAAKYITRYNMLPKEYKLSYDFHAVGAQTD